MRTSLLALSLTLILPACGGGLVNEPVKGDTPVDEGIPNLTIEASTVEFGEVEINTTASESLTLSNTGTAAVVIEALEIDNSAFSATAGAGLEISAGASTAVGLRFLPTSYGDASATLSLTSNDPDEPMFTVTLHGAVVTDGDGDGYDSVAAGGDDCDDDDSTVYPGASDEWYDGVDANCDGMDDYDQDGDGYETDTYNADPSAGGGDCQDANADIHPGAVDVWYDGTDSDCDGIDDWDQDNDGYGTMGHGSDCDDTDPDINPDGTETLNGQDDDCDGQADNDISGYNADRVWWGTSAGDYAGFSLTMGDLDGDGQAEVISGSDYYGSGTGMVSVFDGANLPSSESDITDGRNFFQGKGSSDLLGYSVSYIDAFSTDGGAYLAVGAPGADGNYGKVYVIPAADAYQYGDTDDATLTVSGDGYYYVGRGFDTHTDLNGDGITELWGYDQASSGTASPYLWLLYGDTSGSVSVGDVDAQFSTSGSGVTAYKSFPTGGDLDGDGYDDAIYCDYKTSIDATNDGVVWVVWGGPTHTHTSGAESLSSYASAAVVGAQYERFGWLCMVSDDMDGDGADELWAYSAGESALMMYPGGADMRSASLSSTDDAALAYSFGSSDPDPVTMRPIGDWTGDGAGEVAVGLESSSSKAGQVWIYSSEVSSGEYDGDKDAWAVLEGDSDEPYYQSDFGYAISDHPGDVDGNGLDDFVAGDPGWAGEDGTSTSKGAIYLSLQVE